MQASDSGFYLLLLKLIREIFQQSKGYFSLFHKLISIQLAQKLVPDKFLKITPLRLETILQIQKSLQKLLVIDWQDFEDGLYPFSLLFDDFWRDVWNYYPSVWVDMANILTRLRHKQYRSFSTEINPDNYPHYYLQNFHNQTNGYLSDLSASLYNLQVELLFHGTASVMRRRILRPLFEELNEFKTAPPKHIRVLDIACGTGQTLALIALTMPKVLLFGIDLSPHYLQKAKSFLSNKIKVIPDLTHGNAEKLPYQNDFFDGIVCVYLFHELPSLIRQKVIEEIFRVVKPGGIFIACDSIQQIDHPEFKQVLKNFSAIYYEPYYDDYITDDFVDRLQKAGFKILKVENYFMSKYWTSQKPDCTLSCNGRCDH
jgi:ubiquinone/menaquinone biosynthesis C-methylase UbiE